MYWITGQYALTVNGVGQFQAANPGAGIPYGTMFTSNWFNDTQNELLNILTVCGITPAPGTPTQVMEGLQSFIGKNHETFSANGDFTVPTGVYVVHVECVGAGAGGGGCSGGGGGGAGGGAGGAAIGYVSVTPGQIIPVTVGAAGPGGAAAAAPSGNGGNGGNSSFGTFLTGNGGGGGVGSSPTANSAGGPGGTWSGGGQSENGGYGGDGQYINNSYGGFAGNGGSSIRGGGGRGAEGAGPQTVGQASGSGGGGTYGTTAAAGGAGAPGRVIVSW